jgi:hypothetical protein
VEGWGWVAGLGLEVAAEMGSAAAAGLGSAAQAAAGSAAVEGWVWAAAVEMD